MDINKEDNLRNEMTRLLLGIAPDAEPEKDLTDLFWQLDNAIMGLKKRARVTADKYGADRDGAGQLIDK